MDVSKPANGPPETDGFDLDRLLFCKPVVFFVRQLRGPHLGRWPWCRRRSSMAVTAAVSIRFDRIEEPEDALPEENFLRLPLPREAAFLAGRCFVRYRRRRGARTSPLPGFYIGAHAAVAGLVMLTRDPGRYRTYFPALEIIAPQSEFG